MDTTLLMEYPSCWEDDCNLGVQHLNGFAPNGVNDNGAIRTNSKSFGRSRYIFNSNYGSQTTGLGIPNNVQALIVDNPSRSEAGDEFSLPWSLCRY